MLCFFCMKSGHLARNCPRKLHAEDTDENGDIIVSVCYTLVYAMVSRRYGTVYIGMVGKDSPRKLILRYYEHEREGRAFQRVYGKRLKQHQLYEAMRHTGSSEWVMIPLQVCTEATVWRLEQQWMRTMGRVFNKQRRVWRGQRWRMLAQNLKQHAESWSARELRAVAHKIIHTHRCHTPAHTLLEVILHARNRLQKGFECETYNLLFHKVRSIVARRTGISIPAQIAIPYPICNYPDLSMLQQRVKRALHTLGLPRAVVQYITQVTRYTAKRGPTVAEILCTKRPQHTWQQMHRIARQPCSCHSLPSDIPRIQGCVFARKGRDLGSLFHADAACLRQNCNNATLASWDELESALTSVSAQICRIHRRVGKDKGWLVDALLRPGIKEVWETARSSIPSILHKFRLKALKEQHPGLVFLQLDKNTGKTVCVCRRLYYQTMITAFEDESQFELVEECENKRTAREHCMHLLRSSADAHGMTKLWEGGKGKGPPHAFQLPKNKIQEESTAEWKHRIVFSYYAHPLKRFSRKMGRCLTLLLREAPQKLQSLDMDRITDVKQ